MTLTLKTKSLTVPPAVQRRAGIKQGARLDFRVSGGVITILPDLPTADDEYTPQQRKIIDAQLAEGLKDIRKGRLSPKFNTVQDMLASMRQHRKAHRRQKKLNAR